MMSEDDLKGFPRKGLARNYTWRYHKDLGYGDQLERYGEVTDIETYCKYAQVVNYDQYRSFMEGWASHIWDWYTGILIWKTQNPWTSLRGQMYDWYMDVNASLYGTQKGCEPLHPFYNRATQQVTLLNSCLEDYRQLTVRAQLYNREGNVVWEKEVQTDIVANTVKPLLPVPRPSQVEGVYFLKLSLLPEGKKDKPVFTNVYWLTTQEKDYTTLAQLPACRPIAKASLNREDGRYKGSVTLSVSNGISFFNRIKVFDKETGKRILPVHYTDNYITLMPGDSEEIGLDFPANVPKDRIRIVIDSWTAERMECPLE